MFILGSFNFSYTFTFTYSSTLFQIFLKKKKNLIQIFISKQRNNNDSGSIKNKKKLYIFILCSCNFTYNFAFIYSSILIQMFITVGPNNSWTRPIYPQRVRGPNPRRAVAQALQRRAQNNFWEAAEDSLVLGRSIIPPEQRGEIGIGTNL